MAWFSVLAENSGTTSYACVEVDPTKCKTTRKDLLLTAVPSVIKYDTTICLGDNYTEHGFNIINPPLGLLRDTIVVGTINNCDLKHVVHLNVVSPTINPVIEGNENPCFNIENIYKVTGGLSCQWQLPYSIQLKSGSLNESTIRVKFTSEIEEKLKVTCSNGCVEKTIQKSVKPQSATHELYADSVCLGSVYNKNGWNLGIQNTIGSFAHVKLLGDSCGSSEVLQLYVMDQPKNVKITGDSLICKGESVTLTTADSIGDGDYISIGDVLCTDGTIMKFRDFQKSNKEAKGLVFEVFPDGEHGYAISTTNVKVGFNTTFPYTEENKTKYGIASRDIMRKTHILYYYLNLELEQMSNTDQLVGSYWTSTPANNGRYHILDYHGGSYISNLYSAEKTENKKIRTVYSF